ncbi:MAG: HEAT repeat domain-containing protein [Planctomycetes bacterium]|nr:HEAT repeat domain-containing protein [Planctomycetota bacterium]
MLQPKKCCAAKKCCETKCCNADPCEIAELIYKSQTACYARDRRRALDRLGDRYDCKCNPEIMAALVYGLNDADEKVRKEAADEIGDQLRKNCCCSKEVVAALTTALADCNWGVRRQAEEALEACGYEVVDGCCNPCKKSCCGHGHSAEPSPAPPSESKAVYSPTLRRRSSSQGRRLASLFNLFD